MKRNHSMNTEITSPSEASLQLAAQAWCEPDTSNRVMDPALATAFARILDKWKSAIWHELYNAGYAPPSGDPVEGVAMLSKALHELVERNALQLAACDCAAMMDLAESHESNKVVVRGNPAWSPAFDSVMRRTAECIELRARARALL